MSADSEGGMFGIYLTKSKLENLKDIDKSPKHIFLDFFNYMLDHGVFFAPSMYEAGFISSSHLKRDLDYTIKIFERWAKQK
jgi:glutamate-1-semialdehyde 2,1-aminomutase